MAPLPVLRSDAVLDINDLKSNDYGTPSSQITDLSSPSRPLMDFFMNQNTLQSLSKARPFSLCVMTRLIAPLTLFIFLMTNFCISSDALAKRKRKSKKRKSRFVSQPKKEPSALEKEKQRRKANKAWYEILNIEVEGDFDSLFYNGTHVESAPNQELIAQLQYRVEPIIMAGLKADVSLDLWGLEEVIGTKLEYHGDWFFKSGGSLSEEGDAVETIGGSENLTRILGLIVSTYGLETRYKHAHFDFGEYDLVSNFTGQKLATGSFELDFVQADIFYNFAWKLKNSPSEKKRKKYRNLKRLEAGVRYMEYSVPRMVKRSSAEGGLAIGPIQMITQKAYMLGGELSFVDRDPKTTFGFGVGFGLYYGGGPIAYLNKTGNKKEDFMYMADIPAEFTMRINPFSKDSRFLLNIDISYYVQYITYSIKDAVGGDISRADSFEGSDFFHGPRAKLIFSY